MQLLRNRRHSKARIFTAGLRSISGSIRSSSVVPFPSTPAAIPYPSRRLHMNSSRFGPSAEAVEQTDRCGPTVALNANWWFGHVAD